MRLCRVEELSRTGARGVVLTRQDGSRLAIVLVEDDGCIRAFENRCPHLGAPLETFPDEFLDRQTGDLVCSMHGARFRASDGHCTSGPCAGSTLRTLPVAVTDGYVALVGCV